MFSSGRVDWHYLWTKEERIGRSRSRVQGSVSVPPVGEFASKLVGGVGYPFVERGTHVWTCVMIAVDTCDCELLALTTCGLIGGL